MVGIIDRSATRLSSLISRRNVLTRGAMAGTALAVAPVDYTLKPTSAYAAVCRCNGSDCPCGSLCCDGYSEFCCTLTGQNSCPPGTLLGGWWKATGTNFCGGDARYYLDCNAPCGDCGCGSSGVCSGTCAGVGCGCGGGNCANRKSGCTRFRYGQCNQDIACIGPIMCRVVTCAPPWELFEGECTSSSATDNNTRFHDRPCLHGAPAGAIDSITVLSGSKLRIRGWADDPDTDDPVRVRVYVDDEWAGGVTASRRHPSRPGQVGYEATVTVATGQRRVCVYGIDDRGGPNALLGCRNVQVIGSDGAQPIGWLETIEARPGGYRVTGWGFDPDTEDPVELAVSVDGVVVTVTTADVRRRDVRRVHPDAPLVSGFNFDVTAPAGSHEVCVALVNNGAGPDTRIGCRQVRSGTVGSAPAPPSGTAPDPGPAMPIGWLDRVTAEAGRIRVQGWALDPDSDEYPIKVRVYVDGEWAGGFTADRSRPDVAAAYGRGARHGFDRRIPASPGAHEVCVFAINDNEAGPHEALGCKRVVV